jgi:pyridinium-3,5-biscarboxylic acid mononucleotide synthase
VALSCPTRHTGAVDVDDLARIMAAVADGSVAPDDAVAQLRRLPFADLGFARIDHHRALRQGQPEAVYGPGKTSEQVVGIVGELIANGTGPVIVTRTTNDQAKAALAEHPDGQLLGASLVWRAAPPTHKQRIIIAAAGTADLSVADECATILTAYGYTPTRLTDVGVAGLHRLLPHVDALAAADAIVAVAGMEGALASVIGGLTAAPVIAVPTSVGYGSSFDGVTALLAMLSSCASGVTVVGIDNGFGAACAIARLFSERTP